MKLKGQYSEEGIINSQEALAFILLLSNIQPSSLERKRLQLPVAKRFQYQGGKPGTFRRNLYVLHDSSVFQ
jgi:hypothetical protein